MSTAARPRAGVRGLDLPTLERKLAGVKKRHSLIEHLMRAFVPMNREAKEHYRRMRQERVQCAKRIKFIERALRAAGGAP
jgi:nitrogen fixation/metabolism regulation signal transduction histidine kinase